MINLRMQAVAMSCLACAAIEPPAQPVDEYVEAITQPSSDATLSFVRSGQVAEIRVKPGDAVKPGQVLVQLEDRTECLQVEQLRAEAENDVRIRFAKADLDLKKVTFEQKDDAFRKGAATKLELEEARLGVVSSTLGLELAQFEQAQARLKHAGAKAELERMSLLSPIDGLVEAVLLEKGEAAYPQTEVLRLVKIDPLWIDVPVPLPLAQSLRRGAPADVRFGPAGAQAGTRTARGRIIHIAAVGDSASRTLLVRVEVANPAGRAAGERVRVSFPAPAGPADEAPATRPGSN